MAYTVLNKASLTKVRCLDTFEETLTVSLNPSTTNSSTDYIVGWRVQTADTFTTSTPPEEFWVKRSPGPGYPTDCKAWTKISLAMLKKPQSAYTEPGPNKVDLGTTMISGVTYPDVSAGNTNSDQLSGTFSGAYTRILFPCDKLTYIDGGEDEQFVVEQAKTANDKGLLNFFSNVPDKYDHIIQYRPDPTQFVTLEYDIRVNVVVAGVQHVEHLTLTHMVDSNTNGQTEILRNLMDRQRTDAEFDAKYSTEDKFIPWTNASSN